MIKVKLLTGDGEYVISTLIPPFQSMPDAIFWGQRIFLRKTDTEYREGFVVATTLTGTDDDLEKLFGKEEAEKPKDAGNDDFLFGMPKNLEEAAEAFIDYFRNADDMASIIEMDEDKFSTYAHHGAGRFLRNNWYLWWHENHGYAEWPKSKPELIKFFNDIDIYHADDMSSIIISAAWHKINNKEFDVKPMVERFKKHWRKQGYADGIPRPNKK